MIHAAFGIYAELEGTVRLDVDEGYILAQRQPIDLEFVQEEHFLVEQEVLGGEIRRPGAEQLVLRHDSASGGVDGTVLRHDFPLLEFEGQFIHLDTSSVDFIRRHLDLRQIQADGVVPELFEQRIDEPYVWFEGDHPVGAEEALPQRRGGFERDELELHRPSLPVVQPEAPGFLLGLRIVEVTLERSHAVRGFFPCNVAEVELVLVKCEVHVREAERIGLDARFRPDEASGHAVCCHIQEGVPFIPQFHGIVVSASGFQGDIHLLQTDAV